MVDRKPCIRCAREIDGYARICPFCNWDQSETPSAEPEQQQPELAYTPPKDRRVQKKLFMIGGGVVLLIASFLIGILIHGSDSDVEEEEQEARTTTAAKVNPPRRADVTLVPVTADDLETPITSAPLTTTAEGLPTEYQRSDATAVSSDEYALLAARVKEERRKARAAVDPRSLTGAAYEAAPKPKPPEPPTETTAASEDRPFDREMPTEGLPTASRTRPVPEYQPLPNISVSERMTARLDLVIGEDGRVKEVTVRNTIPGQTTKILAAVQSWRFKPATENGKPVSSAYSVDLSFGNE